MPENESPLVAADLYGGGVCMIQPPPHNTPNVAVVSTTFIELNLSKVNFPYLKTPPF